MWDFFFGTTSKINLLLQKTELLVSSVTRLEKAMAKASEDIKALAKRLDAATNEIAKDLGEIKDQIKEGMSKAEVDEAKEALTSPIERLEALGADPADPVPEPE